ncbi:unnamed protein product [Rhizophagus irregularis]|uniref:Uncharacterized protein n=1 Tax=Rhizophagus irregularis TaxID=588596 RepID=A0A915YZN2_9GLOM|nr:unnamed protein product [Rhizophagus irregularis]CAB5128540.1 unnamed protein product [Rhizophagus irregularis]CAB5354921.1 unnamed protein product [Rhizophagus irregularis]
MNTTTENYIRHEELVTYLTSLAPISSLTMTKWQSIDITWYTHFLNEAKRLLDPNDFITIKDKVSTEHLRYTKKLQTFWQGIIKKYEKENLLVPAETSQSNESLLPKFSETSQLTLISAETLQPDESLLSKKSFLPKVPETSQLTLTLQPDESLLPKKTVKVPNTETLQSDASLLSKMIINKIPLSESSQLNTPSLSNRQLKVPDKILSEVTQLDLPIRTINLLTSAMIFFMNLKMKLMLIYFINMFKNKIMEHLMDLLTINSKLNTQV